MPSIDYPSSSFAVISAAAISVDDIPRVVIARVVVPPGVA
jgi:hypothetical protein